MLAAINQEEVEAIGGGYHGDPCCSLGTHAVKRDWQNDALEVRAFLPQARSVEVLAGGRTVAMEKIHRDGFFLAKFDTQPGAYLLRLTLHDETVVEQEDP